MKKKAHAPKEVEIYATNQLDKLRKEGKAPKISL